MPRIIARYALNASHHNRAILASRWRSRGVQNSDDPLIGLQDNTDERKTSYAARILEGTELDSEGDFKMGEEGRASRRSRLEASRRREDQVRDESGVSCAVTRADRANREQSGEQDTGIAAGAAGGQTLVSADIVQFNIFLFVLPEISSCISGAELRRDARRSHARAEVP